MHKINTLVKICFLISLYYLTYYIYSGLLNPIPILGDSWDYHIPISLSILDGSFISHPHNTIPQWHYPGTSTVLTKIPQWYYPGSSDAINAIFILLNIPTLSNIFAAIVLFFACWKLAITFRLSKNYALLFATTFITLNVILRWLNAVSIDVWIGVWFTLSIILLEKSQKNLFYFAKLGFVLGMLIGSKYTATYFIIVLFVFYLKNVLRYITIPRFLAFLAPFTIFGLFWYIRNYFLTGNPFYPLPRLGFKGPAAFNDTIWIETLHYPIEMFNAGFGEYHVWLFSTVIALVILFHRFIIQKKFTLSNIHKLFLIGLINFIFYFDFPTSAQVWIMVSSFRYSFPAFIPLILGVFLLASKYRKEDILGYFVIANMLPVLSMAYYPKLIFIYLPLSLLTIYYINKK